MTAVETPPAQPPEPLRYTLDTTGDSQVLACDTAGGGRIVEALGDVATADHIAVLVPGNDNSLTNYFDTSRPTRPRRNGLALLHTMRELQPRRRSAVVVWVGYHTPNGFAEAAWNEPARRGAPDLARLTHLLPRDAHVTLVGHSYGTAVCGLALRHARVEDCVALGSPGMGVRDRAELRYGGRLWAALGPSDWIRFFPRGRYGRIGLGPQPLHHRVGALRFATGPIEGHCGYYVEGSESLRNVARIALGRYAEVTRHGAPVHALTAPALAPVMAPAPATPSPVGPPPAAPVPATQLAGTR